MQTIDELPEDRLLFVPLGGSGEIGMNFNLYGLDGQWIAIDCGITFDQHEGHTRVQMPDPRFIARARERLVGLALTHGHEDHIGAVAHLWPSLRCPVWTTPLTAAMVRRKLTDAGIVDDVDLRVVTPGERLALGPFELQFIPITHSIPEANCIAVRSRVGTVLHTGDFRLDDRPILGLPTDEEALRALADEDVLAAVADSTNATIDEEADDEAALRDALAERIGSARTLVAASCFSSNVVRIDSLIAAARRSGRRPVLVGRSILRMMDCASEVGLYQRPRNELHPRDLQDVARDRALVICTGSQGEEAAALTRIADRRHRDVHLDRGDEVIFSSKIIPGNEEAIEGLQRKLRRQGVHVTDERSAFVHVSGHPSRPELRRLYGWVRPRTVVPVHGQDRHMNAHAELAESLGIAAPVIPHDGDVVVLGREPPRVIARVHSGRLELGEGGVLTPVASTT